MEGARSGPSRMNMNCGLCKKKATVHITEIAYHATDGSETTPSIEQKHLCDGCAQKLNMPHMPLPQKGMVDIWKLLQQSARRAREEGGLSCPECGMTLAEFRSKGRLGCPKDYEVFAAHLDPLLSKIHNATSHTGRVPGIDESDLKRMQHLTDLRAKLEEAIREEAYESAARLRDEIQGLEGLEANAES